MRAKDLTTLLRFMVRNREPVLITGSPGIGKTDLVRAASEAEDFDLIIAHPVVDEPIDYKGLPFIVNDKADFLPIGNLHRLIEADRPTVFFLDDLGQAAPATQAAAMQLLLNRAINEQPISDHVTFVAATNRKQDKAGVTGILEPVKSRFTSIVELEVNADDWLEWAMDNTMPPELVGFIHYQPQRLNEFEPTTEIKNSPCPRTVARVGKIIRMGLPEHIRFEAIAGACGEGWASEFEAFYRVYHDLPDPKEALRNPDPIDVEKMNVASKYAFMTALIEYVEKKTVGNFMKLVEKFDREFQAMAVDTVARRKAFFQSHKAFIAWTTKPENRELFI